MRRLTRALKEEQSDAIRKVGRLRFDIKYQSYTRSPRIRSLADIFLLDAEAEVSRLSNLMLEQEVKE